ncbi:toll-like receptor Tollo [Papilio machaon]|uniref:toll-like receptor Tollo n=1 Tax=Papilio machaon TaxID=76193 RepID=UPI001E663A59|nr:toll-like receptor Tollo [Papilio machaon]
MADFKNATTLLLAACKLGVIDPDAFEVLPLLKKLDLSTNYIVQIIDGTFDYLTELEELNLADNFLEDLPVDLFRFNHKLKRLNLNSNLFYNLEVGIFDMLVDLKYLDVSSNVLAGKNWNPDVFTNIVEISSLRFSANDMSESPNNLLSSLKKLSIIELKNCHLSEYPTFLKTADLKTLIILNLKKNRIHKIDEDAFQNFEKLFLLNLSFNRIEYIDENSFKTLKELKFLTLKKNRLLTIPTGLFSSTYKLSLLDLSRNKITVIQDDLFKRTDLNNLNLSHNKLTYLQRNFCKQQKNARAALKVFYFNHNPWQCACLRDLLGEIKGLGIKYNTSYFDGGQPVCVTTKEFVCKRQENLNSFYVDLFDSTIPNIL